MIFSFFSFLSFVIIFLNITSWRFDKNAVCAPPPPKKREKDKGQKNIIGWPEGVPIGVNGKHDFASSRMQKDTLFGYATSFRKSP